MEKTHRYQYEQYLHGRAVDKKLTGRRVNIHLCDIMLFRHAGSNKITPHEQPSPCNFFFFFFFFILRRMGKNKALAHHTPTFFHARRLSIYLSCYRIPTLAGAPVQFIVVATWRLCHPPFRKEHPRRLKPSSLPDWTHAQGAHVLKFSPAKQTVFFFSSMNGVSVLPAHLQERSP